MCILCQQLGIDLHKLDAGGFDGAADAASASWAALPANPGADAESLGSDTVPGSTGTSSTLSGASSVRGFINAGGDQDWYAVTLTAGQTYTFALSGFGVGALSDAYLRLLDSAGVQVAFDDDSGPLANSKLTFTASASGTFYVSAQGYGTTTGQYLLTMATGTTPYAPVIAVGDVADFLTNTYWEVNGSIAHHWGVSTISYNVQGLSAARADLARVAFQLWSEVANLTFVETTGTGQITLDDTQSGAFSSSNYGGNGIITSATVNVDPTWYGSSSAIDSYTLQTFIHEIGHALGLGHAGPYNGSATYGVDNIYANDTWQYTLMSYMAESNFGGVSYRFTMTPMMADILAIQNLYGAPTTRTGDTVYGFGSTAGSMYNFSTYSTAPSLTIYDSGGTDTLNTSGYSQNQVINLAGGTFSNIGGLVGNIGIYTTSVIENAVGGSGNDTITGNSVSNVLTGGGGADTLNGLAGDDTLDGGTGNDTMLGGIGNDVYYVDSLSDVVTENSGEGTDTIYASVNGYTLAANVEIGRISLTTGATLTGNALNNTLYGNSGNDTLDGGAGTDTVVYSGLASNYQLVHNANGTWTITDLRTGSPDGTDTLTNIEQIQFSDTLVSLDTVLSAPTISSFSNDSGTAGDNITNDNTLTLTGSAAAGSNVSIYDGATLLGAVIADGSGAWTFTTGTLTDATHSFSATADDGLGHISAASTVLAVTVDTVAPSAPTISSYSTDSGTVGDGVTNDNTLTFTGTAAAGATVSVYDGATFLGTAIATGSGAWTFTTGALTDATHSFSATASDAAGNVSAASSVLAVTVDTVAPSAPTISTYSSDSGIAGDGITNDNTLTVIGAATAGSTVSIYDGATLLGSAIANGTGGWSFTTGALADATHSFTARASDAAGNASAASAALSVTIDTVAPGAPAIVSFSTDSGTVGDRITNDNTLTLTGTAAASSTLSIYDGATLLGTTASNGAGAWSFTTGVLSDATHSLTATATDSAANVSAASAALTVTIDTVAPGAPTISSYSTDSAVVGDGITNDNTLTLVGTAAAGSAISVYDGATLLGTAAANGAGAWTFTTGALADGAHSLTATASDVAGNSAMSGALAVTIDTAAPGVPTIASFSTDSGTVGDSVTNDNTLTLTGAAAAGSTVSIYDGATLLGNAMANGVGAWSFTTGALTDATHALTARATDAAGNVSAASAALNVTIDTAAPVSPTIGAAVVNSFGISGSAVTLTGTAEGSAIVNVYGMDLVKGSGATLLGTMTAAPDGAWSFATGSLSGTVLRFTATASDAAGNLSSSSALFNLVVIDSSPTGGSADAADVAPVDQSFSLVSDAGWSEIGKTEPAYDGHDVNIDEIHQASLMPGGAFLLV
jgi:hypothetical protein